ncbi:MAG TPA: hypothetical protein ENO08_04390, partial [Candidatus Eisenbacteria bacterium]|nr:hypothetical protein [Candidatus Eisenbacteria bacterium]
MIRDVLMEADGRMDSEERAGTWKDVRSEFPVSDDIVYFNHAAISPLSLTARKALDSLSETLARGCLAEEE